MLKILSNDNPTSFTLLSGLHAIDGAAWEEFVRRYSPAIHLWVRRRGVAEVDACDLTQDILLKLLSSLRNGSYDRSKGSFRSWLQMVVSNAAADWFRSAKRYSNMLDELTVSEQSDSLADVLEQEYQAELFERAIELVAPRFQRHTWDAFRLTGLENRPVKEVAEELGLSVAQVYVAKNRILNRLKVVTSELAALDERLV